MAGKPGRSGGKREGAGRKPKLPGENVFSDPSAFLAAVMRGEIEANQLQVRSAIALLRTQVPAKGGKKAEKDAAAAVAAKGKFGPSPGPRLATVGGTKVANA